MPVYGKVIVIRRNGTDGSQFPITNNSCLFGRGIECDIRVQLPYVSNQQCKLLVDENGKFMLQNISETNQTTVNGKSVKNGKEMELNHKDVLTIVDRSFRFEYPENQDGEKNKVENIKHSTLEKKNGTPLRKIQEPANDSPFSLLVKDMKQSIKLKTINKPAPQKPINSEETSGTCQERSDISETPNINVGKSFKYGDSESLTEAKETENIDVTPPESLNVNPAVCVDDQNNIEIEATPHILLNSNNSIHENSDPYEFPCEGISDKKNRRRSSECNGMSKKKQKALFGSPRTPKIKPLRSSMGELRRKSIPLLEDFAKEQAALSNEDKKIFYNLSEVEVENNSSPIKKKRRSLRDLPLPSTLNEPIQAVRRKSRVSFGPKLSPEQFLKHFPPNTPIKKGATPVIECSTGRRSMRLSNLSTVMEGDKVLSSPQRQQIEAQIRTPTPYKPANKGKQINLLQSTLQNIMDKKLGDLRDHDEEHMDVETENESSTPRTSEQKRSRKSFGNVPLVNVHRTATNLHKRKSIGKQNSKPLWSDIVKRHPVKIKQTKKQIQETLVLEKKNVTKEKELDYVQNNSKHCDSPATLYIGRTRKRIYPIRTPKPAKGLVVGKINLPLNESFTGMTEMFNTPSPSSDLFENLHTPQTIGEMQVSPLLNEVTHGEVTQVVTDEKELGASPLLVGKHQKKNRSPIIKKVIEQDFVQNTDRNAGKTANNDCNNLKCFEIGRLFNTPKETVCHEVEGKNEDIGTKQLLKTPKDKAGCSPVEENFGTKRLFTTPTTKGNVDPGNENLGLQKMFDTPTLKRKYDFDESMCIEELKGEAEDKPIADFNTESQTLVKTAKRAKNEPVSEHYGLRRLLKTPKQKVHSKPVTEQLGTVRLFNTPKTRSKGKEVKTHFGTKRIFTTPKVKTTQTSVDGNYGIKRMVSTPKEKPNDIPTEETFGTSRLLKTPKGKQHSMDVHFGINDLFRMNEEKQHSHPSESLNETLCLDKIFPEDMSDDIESKSLQKKLTADKTKRQRKKFAVEATRKSRRNATTSTNASASENIVTSEHVKSNAESLSSHFVPNVPTQQEGPTKISTSGRGKKDITKTCIGNKSEELVPVIKNQQNNNNDIGQTKRNKLPQEKILETNKKVATDMANQVIRRSARGKKVHLVDVIIDSQDKESTKDKRKKMQENEKNQEVGRNCDIHKPTSEPLSQKVSNSKESEDCVVSPVNRKTRSNKKVVSQEIKNENICSKTTGDGEKTTKGRQLRSKQVVKQDVAHIKPNRVENEETVGVKQNMKRPRKNSKTMEENANKLWENQLKIESGGSIGHTQEMENKKTVTFHHSVLGGMTPIHVPKRKAGKFGNISPDKSGLLSDKKSIMSTRQLRKRKAPVDNLGEDANIAEVSDDVNQTGKTTNKKPRTSKTKVRAPSKENDALVLRRSSRLNRK